MPSAPWGADRAATTARSRREGGADRRATVVVVGGTSALAPAIVAGLAAAGHPVVIGASGLGSGAEVVETVHRLGGVAAAFPLQLDHPGSIEAFADRAGAWRGPVGALVVTPGDLTLSTVVGAAPESFSRQLAENLGRTQALVHQLVPGMLARREGDVIFVCPDGAVRPRSHLAGQVAAMAGLEAMAAEMAIECEGTGVRVGVLRLGPTQEDLVPGWPPRLLAEAIASWERWGHLRSAGVLSPAEVAEAVVTMLEVPRTARVALLELQPEAPLARG